MAINRRSGTYRAGRLWLGSSDAPDIMLILAEARARKATDVHIMAHSQVHFRVDGQLQPLSDEVLTASAARHLACALLSENQVAQLDEQLDIDFMVADPNQLRYRVNVGYFNGSAGATIRLLPREPMPLESLGLPPVVSDLAERGKGLILITGSTSQGKTTTMASLIDAINRRSRKHIITVEDPIEVVHQNKQSLVRQREVGRDTKSFASGLRAALRQDPDVVMIGEMRDAETIETALRAAEVGVLVISTLHIVSIEKLIDRLITYMPPGRETMIRAMVAEVLQAVIHQELLPTVDGGKRVACEILIATRAVRSHLRGGSEVQLRSALMSGREVGMQTMTSSLDALLAEEVISEGVYHDVVKNYASFA
ncbi:MAG TPA: PilT/PilU family type 4a pilus ATPase [Gemmatimonadaceae bacterium]|nr:PilT/PilU family type 4a pilus ATPase [Gemmatimonadaceae bacterium]